jgi:hypothetical protein
MIGSGMPTNQSSAPLPKPMSASCMMEFYAPTGRRFQPGNCGTQKLLKPTIGSAVESFQARDSILFGRFLFLGRLSDGGGSGIGVAMRSPNFPESAIASMRRERTAAGDGPAGNEHVLRGVLAGCGDCIKILDLDGSS